MNDGPGRARTCDLGIKSPLLYQLSYRPPSGSTLPGWGKGTRKEARSRNVRRRSTAATIPTRRWTSAEPRSTARTDDEPEQHFIGWLGEVDPDELFASGAAWGIKTVRQKR